MAMSFNLKAISNMPKPMPMYEIFVYSPRVEGVHLRGGPVARGSPERLVLVFRCGSLGLVSSDRGSMGGRDL